MIRLRKAWLTAGLAAAAAILLYWPTLDMPIIYDSLLHIRITKSLDFANVWLPTDAFGFYRPLTFFPLLVIHSLWGFYPNWLLHGLNVFQHGLNAALLAGLVWRLWRHWQPAMAAGLIFAFFPFSYQAVAVYGHNVHPATAGLILMGLHAYLNAEGESRKTTSITWWGITAVLFFLSLLSHESAVLFGAFAGLVHVARSQASFHLKRDVRRFISRPRISTWTLFLAAGAVYAVVYQFLPISRAPQAGSGAAALGMKTLYLLQAAVYPLAWFSRFFPERWGIGFVLMGVTVTAVFVIWRVKQKQLWRPFLLGWGWWALAGLVVVLPLPASYLLHGPRLLYLSSIGVAIGWGAMLTSGLRATSNHQQLSISTQRLRPQILAGVVLLFVLGSGGWFVRQRLRDYERLASPVRAMQTAVAADPAVDNILFVNLPQWIAPPRQTYPEGEEFVAMLADYLFVEELAWENGAAAQTAFAARLSDVLGAAPYGYAVQDQTPLAKLASLSGRTAVILTRYLPDGVTADYQGSWQPGGGSEATAVLGPYQLIEGIVETCSGMTVVTLTWQTDGPMPPTTSIFVQAFSADGHLITQSDGPPLGVRPDLLPKGLLQLKEIRRLNSGKEPPDHIIVGAYDYTSGERFDGYDQAGHSLENNAWLIQSSTACP